MNGEVLVNEIHYHPGGCLVAWWKLLHPGTAVRCVKIQQTCVGTVPPTSYSVVAHLLGGAGCPGGGECGPLPCAVDSILILSMVSSQ